MLYNFQPEPEAKNMLYSIWSRKLEIQNRNFLLRKSEKHHQPWLHNPINVNSSKTENPAHCDSLNKPYEKQQTDSIHVRAAAVF